MVVVLRVIYDASTGNDGPVGAEVDDVGDSVWCVGCCLQFVVLYVVAS